MNIHVIVGLDVGGAETFLLRYLAALSTKDRENTLVFSLKGEGAYGAKLREYGVRVECLQVQNFLVRPLFVIKQLVKLFTLSRKANMVFWMYHAMAISVIFRWRAARIVWAVRRALDGYASLKLSTKFILWWTAIFSRYIPDAIFYNSRRGMRQHEEYGFDAKKSSYIPNGVDCGVFSRSVSRRAALRRQLQIPPDALVGIWVGRLEAVKGPDTLRQILPRFLCLESTYFLMVGREVAPYSREYISALVDEKLQHKLIFLGERTDVADLLSVADIYVSCSYSEGFPNALAEAMSASLIPVVTDVGDSAILVSDIGYVCSPNRPEIQIQYLEQIVSRKEDIPRLGYKASDWMRREFSFDASLSRIGALIHG